MVIDFMKGLSWSSRSKPFLVLEPSPLFLEEILKVIDEEGFMPENEDRYQDLKSLSCIVNFIKRDPHKKKIGYPFSFYINTIM